MRVAIYTIGMKNLIGTYETMLQFEDSFYHCKMPMLSASVCEVILDKVSPNYKISEAYLIFENMETGYVGSQKISSKGTIIIF